MPWAYPNSNHNQPRIWWAVTLIKWDERHDNTHFHSPQVAGVPVSRLHLRCHPAAEDGIPVARCHSDLSTVATGMTIIDQGMIETGLVYSESTARVLIWAKIHVLKWSGSGRRFLFLSADGSRKLPVAAVGGWIGDWTNSGIGRIAEFVKCLSGKLLESCGYPLLFSYPFLFGGSPNIRRSKSWGLSIKFRECCKS